MPPLVTTTACARNAKSPITSRLLGAPRRAASGASRTPWTPSTAPAVVVRASTRCRKARVTRPPAACSRTRRSKGSTSPGPVPQTRWKRGTELPRPSARPDPRSAQPTTGNNRTPRARSQARFSPAANSTYARAHRCGQRSAGRSPSRRSKPAVPSQSCQASAAPSRMPIRRCSGESTRKSPPNDQKAWPPRLASLSWSTRTTRRPASASSAVAARPARPAPTTIASASNGLLRGALDPERRGEGREGLLREHEPPEQGEHVFAGLDREVALDGERGEPVHDRPGEDVECGLVADARSEQPAARELTYPGQEDAVRVVGVAVVLLGVLGAVLRAGGPEHVPEQVRLLDSER